MSLRLYHSVKSPAKFIRDHLQKTGKDYAYNIYRAYREAMLKLGYRPGSHQTFYRVVYCLKRLGVIRPVERRPARFTVAQDRVYYALASGRQRDECWQHPQIALIEKGGGGRV